MMENPLNEGYKKIKKGKSWGLENRGGGGTRETSEERFTWGSKNPSQVLEKEVDYTVNSLVGLELRE